MLADDAEQPAGRPAVQRPNRCGGGRFSVVCSRIHQKVRAGWLGRCTGSASAQRGGIYKVVKHPMLTAVKLWALSHLLSNGDLGSIILFGAFLAWAVVDRISLKRRTDPGSPPIPVGGPLNDVIAVAVGIVAYLALGFAFHPVVIGVPVFGA